MARREYLAHIVFAGRYGVEAMQEKRMNRAIAKPPLPLKAMTGRAHLPRAEREAASRRRQMEGAR